MVHHLLWPPLWQDLTPLPALTKEGITIQWRNYYDFGDPIAYELTSTREWLHKAAFDQILKLEEIDYSRSYLPGKAHVDYWTDNDVFAHFIDQVVCAPKPAETEGKTTPKPKPASKWPAIIVSYAVPKLLIAALMCIAVYAIYRPVPAAIAATPVPSKQIFTDVLGLGLLLLGVTAAARLPRLTNKWRWWLVSAGCLVLAMAAYEKLVHDDSRALIGALFAGTPLGPTTALKPSLSSSRSLRERSRAGSPGGGRASCRSWGCSRSSASCAT